MNLSRSVEPAIADAGELEGAAATSAGPSIGECEFAAAYTRHFPGTLRFIRSFGADRELAEEVAQAAWARGWQYRRQLLNPELVGAWVKSIARNLYRGVVVTRQRFEEIEEISAPSTILRTLEADSMMNVCSPKELKMLSMFYIEGYTAIEIARKENMCPTTVRVRLMRIRRNVRERIGYLSGEAELAQAA